MTTSYLGIDAGGTKLRWRAIGDDARSLADGAGGGVQLANDGIERAGVILSEMLLPLHRELDPAMTVIGIAGGGAAASRDQLLLALRERGVDHAVAVCGDPEVAAAAALTERPGIAVWSGTGSFAIARDATGRLHRVGGRGFLLGDRGSGFAIARAAAAAAVEAFDGIGPETVLVQRLADEFGLASVENLGAIMQSAPPREVAACAPIVLAAAAAGDEVASRVLDAEAVCLAALARSVARRAGVDLEPCSIGGGLLRHSPEFVARFTGALGGIETVQAVDGAEGAARLARAVGRGEAPLADWVR